MPRQLLITKDGSHTIQVPGTDCTYHSLHGAIQESRHVFINAGLHHLKNREQIKILEIGFGTGLNALLTLIEAEKLKTTIFYTAIELHPLLTIEYKELNYCEQLNQPELSPVLLELHECTWEQEVEITPFITLEKKHTDLVEYNTGKTFDLVYFDAFDPSAQPELWTVAIFKKIAGLMNRGAVLVTYCSKSEVRRNMMEAGLSVEKIPGPHGKREMVRATMKE